MHRADYTTEKESYEEQVKAGRYNPADVLVYKNKRFTLRCGESDILYVWVDDKETFILVINENQSQGYIGAELWGLSLDPDDHYEVFLQGAEYTQEIADMGTVELRDYLMEYLY